ncbi:hypothetical protein YIM73518_17690 [Thermus brockianus]
MRGAEGKGEPWYLAVGVPGEWEPRGYRLRTRIAEAFWSLRGGGLGWSGTRLWFRGMGLLGAALRGRGWLLRVVVARPGWQSLFRLARLLLAEGPPSPRSVVVRVLGSLARQQAKGWDESSGSDLASKPPPSSE